MYHLKRNNFDVIGRVVHETHRLVGAWLGLHALNDVNRLRLHFAEAAVRLGGGALGPGPVILHVVHRGYVEGGATGSPYSARTHER